MPTSETIPQTTRDTRGKKYFSDCGDIKMSTEARNNNFEREPVGKADQYAPGSREEILAEKHRMAALQRLFELPEAQVRRWPGAIDGLL